MYHRRRSNVETELRCHRSGIEYLIGDVLSKAQRNLNNFAALFRYECKTVVTILSGLETPHRDKSFDDLG